MGVSGSNGHVVELEDETKLKKKLAKNKNNRKDYLRYD